MAQFIQADMLEIMKDPKDKVFLVTTNSFLAANETKLTMGAGFAKAIRDKFPGFDEAAARSIKARGHGQLARYGVVPVLYSHLSIYLFQVKYHWKSDADLELIHYSARFLAGLALSEPTVNFYLNYPGIGKGNLTEKQVHPFLNILPNNVYVCTWGE